MVSSRSRLKTKLLVVTTLLLLSLASLILLLSDSGGSSSIDVVSSASSSSPVHVHQLECLDLNLVVRNKLRRLHAKANTTILVHMHIPKVGGTALALALSSECDCHPRQRVEGMCTHCPVVAGHNNFTFRYSVSRTSGWIFGIHPPLAKLIGSFHSAKKRNAAPRNGLLPVYIVMLREPFSRFVSEAHNWAGSQQVGMDWGVWYKASVGRDASTPYLPGHARSLDTYVEVYSALPPHYVLHNRQTKFIGGYIEDFKTTFDSRKEVGSIWKPNDTAESIGVVRAHAESLLAHYPSLLIGMHERFDETVCALEVLYGHLYRFDLEQQKRHAHDPSRWYSRDTELKMVDRYRTGPLGERVLGNWRRRNEADEILYMRAVSLFDVQTKEALRLLRELRAEGKVVRAPHCQAFVD